ncbi:MAG: DUF3160 domain-containing protein [Planctomycetes bacterium]|nr:DUF3160 domain-containing protein [Planctomycetota bacterium]
MRSRCALAISVVFVLGGSALGQHGLTETERQLLKNNKFIITATEHKQVFRPYIGSDVPVFITTDSLLNGFPVLLELDELAKNLKRPTGATFDPAYRRAATFLGVARNLLDANAWPAEPALRKTVLGEAARIIAAKDTSKPAWLGPPDAGFLAVDYTRFLPRGLYTKSPAMERYFRAVAWLQAIPFRLERDDEFAALLLLSQALGKKDAKLRRDMTAFCGTFKEFLGAGDDWDILAAAELPTQLTKKGLDELREDYRKRGGSGGEINDQLRFAPTTRGGKAEIGFRFLSAHRLADAVLFMRTMHPNAGKRDFPDGLELCAALRSPYARAKLAKEMPRVTAKIVECEDLFFCKHEYRAASAYVAYLQCLAVLLERVEPDAPEFMRKEAWQIKTCQTVLGGWAQMRHTWALQAKQSVHYLSAFPDEAGYVEPVPEFYAKMTELVERIRDALERAGAFDTAAAEQQQAADLLAAIRIFQKAEKDKKGLEALTPAEIRTLAQFSPYLNDWHSLSKERKNSKDALGLFRIYFESYGISMKDPSTEDLRGLAREMGGTAGCDWAWDELVSLCRQLERLSHKQLRGLPWTEKEQRFVRNYGKALASLMGYTGHAWMHPRDDAPRIVDVFSNPGVGQHLLVGVSKPREIWMLYPVKGKEVLCRGAVLPYHEFTSPTRLTDSDWRARLASPDRPAPPAWLRPILADPPNKTK